DVKGEISELKNTINTMVDQLSSFASEVTRVAREVGTEGKLGGQAQVKGVSGTWKDLTDNVNFMAGNLTGQVRGIARVVTSVANGDLKQKLTLEAKGEIAELADTINSMIETLATFADQVTTVARLVGVEGKLGGQAKVPGAAGTWKDLTDNVNQLAANLTTQVRAIAEVATAVTKGDLTRSITVEAQGEVASLKDTITEMIRNLKDTTLKNSEQDWLKTNLAKFSRMLQGQKDLLTVGRLILSELAPVVSAQHAVFYVLDANRDKPVLTLLASYAYEHPEAVGSQLALGQGLVGQCALEKSKILLANVPENYVRISSGLGNASPLNIIVLPVVFEGQVKAVLELGSFERFNPTHQAFLDQLMESIGIVLNTIEANMRTENLLKQSQSLAKELGSRQEELQQTNLELQENARLLAHQNVEVERKNREVEQARQALEEKAKQLSLTSKYKSEFLANMSHELRTPLNSLLILSDQLARNTDGNLTSRQTEFAKTIHSSGNDLLMLINDILDLSKIESGTVAVDIGELMLDDLHNYVERTFRHIAESRNVDFLHELKPALPNSIQTDSKRLQQIIKNLLSNAFKFTSRGRVSLTVELAQGGWSPTNEELNHADEVLAFIVSDTGIGIAQDKQQIIFEAFQQADGSTSRKYGGTGLGLAISRELARLLGGEITLHSVPGRGSTFTLFVPQTYTAPAPVRKGVLTARQPEAEASAPVEQSVDPSLLLNEVGDDRSAIRAGDRVVLIVDNDLPFARLLLETAREQGFKGIATSSGAAALALARDFQPHAVTLDITLPDIDGWRVLDHLKSNPATRHIPVYVISTVENPERGLDLGAFAILPKPIQSKKLVEDAFRRMHEYLDRPTRRLLLVNSNGARDEILDLVGGDGIHAVAAASCTEACDILAKSPVDCVVLDMHSPDSQIDSLLDGMSRRDGTSASPLVVYLREEIPPGSQAAIRRIARNAPVRQARSRERLLDHTALFLHRPLGNLSAPQREIVEQLYKPNSALAGRKVLIVDDDIRNIFALASVLERQNLLIESAETGHDAIRILKEVGNIDIVLMDIMMPEMDGIDTMKAIRRIPEFRSLPIIAVTAKAMKGDREKCIEAGAWDYLSKPVDTEQLLMVLRTWLAVSVADVQSEEAAFVE
ncbi:MAG: response regulator, partial [Planctomycetaceae bacterium]|nr:response regulator [Planctomycetaceae bacterium]